MKKIIYLICALVLVWGCTRDPNLKDSIKPNRASSLTIEEAKTFFEKQYSENRQTRVDGGGDVLSPGDFTPNWNNAVESQNQYVQSVDVTINSQYCYRAIRSECNKGIAEAYEVAISQKLVIVKGKVNGKEIKSYYIMTLIPDRNFYAKNKNDLDKRFINSGNKNGFTGIVLYTIPGFSCPLQVCKYSNGIKTNAVCFIGCKDNLKEKIEKAKQLVGNIEIIRSVASIGTRGWEDMSYDWTQDDDANSQNFWDDMLDMGKEHYPDGDFDTWFDGNGYWYDSTGNGEPDTYYPLFPPDPTPPDWPDDPDNTCPGCGNYPCTCSSVCPNCGSDPCTCTDDSHDDDPFLGDDDPSSQTDAQSIIDKLMQNKIAKKLLERVKLDRIKITPVPPGKDNQQGVTHKDGSIEIHSTSPMVLLEELMHRFQQENNIHGRFKGNVEIEAKLLIWDYLTSEFSYNGIIGNFGPAWGGVFGSFAENPCEETWQDAIEALIRMGYEPSKFPTSDYTDFKDDNYQSLK